uniref:Uncharacterized protein n=1 Tax=Oryza rufipogon TaxID=4529 RepID=A0A0E0NTB7_ORYRU
MTTRREAGTTAGWRACAKREKGGDWRGEGRGTTASPSRHRLLWPRQDLQALGEPPQVPGTGRVEVAPGEGKRKGE